MSLQLKTLLTLIALLLTTLNATQPLSPLVEEGEPLSQLKQHYILQQSFVIAVAISEDGKTIVSGSANKSIKVWDAQSGKFLKTLEGHSSVVNSVAISKDGKTIVSGSRDKSIKVWDTQSGRLLKTLEGHRGAVTSVAISQDGKTIVSGSWDNSIKVWNAKSGKLLKILEGHSGSVRSVAISQDGKTIVSGSWDKSIKVWDAQSGKLLKTLEGHSSYVISVAISKDGKTIVSGSSDKSIKLWDAQSGKLLKTLEGHSDFVRSVAISEDGKTIISGSNDNSIKLWDAQSGKLLKTLEGHSSTVNSVAISEDGKTVVSGSLDNSIKVWDAQSGRLLKTLEGHSDFVGSVAISEDGKTIVSGSGDRFSRNSIKLWDAQSGKLLKTLEGHSNDVNSVAISKDGKTIVSGSDDNSIKLWDAQSGKLLKTLEGHSNDVTSVAISEDGKTIVSGSLDNSIKVWDAKSGKLLKTLEGHSGSVHSVAISKDGKTIVSGSDDHSIKVWDVQSGKPLKTLEGHSNSVFSVAISKDGKTIVSGSGDHSIKVWNAQSGKLLKTLEGHNSTINSVAISQDGKTIVSGSFDNRIKLWDTQSGKLLKTLEGHSYFVTSITISKDGKTIVSGSWDMSIKVWDAQSGKLLKSLWGGVNGCWVAEILNASPQMIFRGDDGTMLYTKKKSILTPFYPSDYNLTKKDKLKITLKEHNLSLATGEAVKLHFVVENLAKSSSYFLTLDGSGEGYALKSKKIDRVKAGEKREIEVKLFVKLDDFNPKPTELNATLNLTSGNGTDFSLSFPVKILSPYLVVKEAKVSEDRKNLNVLVVNQGSVALETAEVKLSSPFEADPQTFTSLKVDGSKTLSFALPKEFDQTKALNIRFEMPNREEIAKNPSTTKIAPAYAWSYEDVKIDWAKVGWWIYATLIFLVILLMGSVRYFLLYRNPLVQRLAEEPKEIFDLEIGQLLETEERLEKIDRLESTLKLAEVSEDRFKKAIAFSRGSVEKRAELFAEQIGTRVVKEEENFYYLEFSESFSLSSLKKIGVYIASKPLFEIENSLLAKGEKIFVISKEQDKIAKLAHDKSNNLIAPTAKELNRLMLSNTPQEEFILILSNCLLPKEISPYQTNGDIHSEENFFGRVEILREIVGNHRGNYFIVGARQMGKSSILKAIERRYLKQNRLCYYMTLDERGEIVEAMAEAMGLESVTIDEITQHINHLKDRPTFLIDEADMFIAKEVERNYLITSIFRKLSQENRATFILSGFWRLYQEITSDYHAPLKNFGKIKIIGGLEREACVELMKKPMSKIGIVYEDDEIIEKSIALCGYRANYLSIVCDEMVNNLKKSTITNKDLEEALDSEIVTQMLQGWGAMSIDKYESRVDRLIVYLTVKKESFRIGFVVEELKRLGLEIDIEVIQKSLDRLVLGYVLKRVKGDYGYQIPLLKERLLEDDLDYFIEGEVISLKSKIQ